MPETRGRPPKITADEIIKQAMRYDLRTISMRQVARDLKVTDAALYYHFPTRDLLRRTIAERLTGEFALPRRSKNWRRWLEKFAYSLRAILKDHPGTAHYLVIGGPVGTGQLKIIDHALGVLIEAGFSPGVAWYVYTTVVNFVLRQTSADEQVAADAITARLSDASAVLPHLSRALAHADIRDRDAYFAFGLNAILSGIKVR